MEKFKTITLTGVAVLVFIGLCVIGYLALFVNATHYYTRISNAEVKHTSSNEYEYTLDSYDEHGKVTRFTFKANKELRENAFLELDVMFVRGVVNWREVQYDELPQDVRSRYSSNSTNQSSSTSDMRTYTSVLAAMTAPSLSTGVLLKR